MRTRFLVLLTVAAMLVSAVGPAAAAEPPPSNGPGSIIGWGGDWYGQATPPAGNDFVAIAAGSYHNLALKSDGSIVGWGANIYGESTPPAGNDFVAIAAGEGSSLALKNDGSIVGWGANFYGESAPPAGNDFVAIAAGHYFGLALKRDGSIVGWGLNDWRGQATPPAGNDFVAITAGWTSSLALKSDGSIVGWGADYYGQATPPAGNDFVAVAAGYMHCLALKSDGSIVGWGNDYYGQATPPAGNDFVAIAAAYMHSLALRSDGSIVGWGVGPGDFDDFGQATPPAGNDFVAIAAGRYHSLGLKRTNHAPSLTANAAVVAAYEGQQATNGGLVSDPDGDPVMLTASSGTVVDNGDGTWSWSFDAVDGPADSQIVTISAEDGNGGTTETSFELVVHNVAPVIGAVTAPAAPVLVYAEIVVDAAFADPGSLDTHTAVLDWGDGQASPGTVNETGGSGTVSGSHLYNEAGVYTVGVTVTDNDGGVGVSCYEYVVVYDPSAGFVTGGGWIDSPAGAYVADPTLVGRASFGFVAKYKKGATVPDGNTEFQFKAAGLNFKSTSYDWLVVSGSKASFRGVGTINGTGSYRFCLSVIDGDTKGADRFRIRIWGDTGLVYDNLVDANASQDFADPPTVSGSGSIIIHR